MTTFRAILPASFALVLAGGALAACSRAEPPSPAPAASAPARETTPTRATPTAAPVPPTAMMSIPERFQSEAHHRPGGVPKVEDVLASFEQKGAPVREKAQHLAAPFLAKYCVGAKAGEDVHVSVCEYDDAKVASRGREASATAFAAVPNRTLYQNGGTTLTVRLGKNGRQDQALAKTIVSAFMNLKPTSAPPQKT